MASRSKFHAIRRPNGLYQAHYWVVLPGGEKKRETIYDRDIKSLRERWNRAVAENICGTIVSKNNITLAEYITSWMDSRVDIKSSTMRGYRSNINVHIIPRIGKSRLSDLSISMVQKMMSDIIKDGHSARSTQIAKAILNSVLKQAAAEGLARPNIMQYVKLKQHNAATRDIWTKEQMQIFANAIVNERYRLFYELYMIYGLRRGEAIPLRWGDIDFENKVIHIRRSCISYKGGPIIETPKTEKSKRVLPLVSHIENLLKQLPKGKPEDYILTENGTLVNPEKVSRRFKTIAKNAGLPEVVLHSLRHFAATMLKDAGVDVKDTQAILGHSTSQITLNIYEHSDLEAKRRAINKSMNYANLGKTAV